MNSQTDFVKRYPFGSDAPTIQLPESKPMRSFIPERFSFTVRVEALVAFARMKGYSEEDIARIRQRLEPPLELMSVSLDDIYGPDGEVES